MAQNANTVFRDFTTEGVPSSGANKVEKAKVRELLTGYESAINTAFTSGSSVIFSTKAAIDASLGFNALTLAWVVTDPVAGNNGIYQKIGASGTGSWSRKADLPYSFILASNAGAGMANAIVATSSIPIPVADGGALIMLPVTVASTASPVTVSFNGGAPLTIKTSSGNDVAPGGMTPGIWAGFKVGSTFRLISEQASAALLAQIEGLVDDAQAAALAAQDAASSVTLTTFATKAAAEAYSPTVAPTFLTTAFYDAAQLPGSGAKYKKNVGGTKTGNFKTGVYALDGSPISAGSAYSFTRAGSATYFDASGVLQTAASNALRIDYDPVTHVARGALVEGAATNLWSRSEELDNVAWTRNASPTVTANAVLAPDGTMTADRFETAAATCGVWRGISLAAGTTYTNSVHVLPVSGTKRLRCDVSGVAFGSTQTVVFDLAAGTIISNAGGLVCSIAQLASGWWRVSVTRSAVASDFGAFAFYSNDAAATVFCLWGAQLEGGPKPTSYIKTVAGTVTREADSLTLLDTGASVWSLTLDDGSVQKISGGGNGLAIDPSALSRARVASYKGTLGDLVIVAAGVNVGYSMVADPVYSTPGFGVVGAVDDRTVWQNALDTLNHGDVLHFPAGLTSNIVNAVGVGANVEARRANAVATGGLRALTCDKDDITLVIDGKVQATTALDDLFVLTGKRAKVFGTGSVGNTSGDFITANSSDIALQWRPTLIRLEGEDTEVAGIRIFDQPTYGIWSRGNRGWVHHVRQTGGPTVHLPGENTNQMAIYIGDGMEDRYGHKVESCDFQRSAAGGAAYSAIFGVSRESQIYGNSGRNMLEHFIYNYGDDCTISGNIYNETLAQMYAGAIQCFSQGTTINDNIMKGNNNSISMQRMSRSVISENSCGGISLRTYYGDTSSTILDDVKILDNTIATLPGQIWPIDVTLGQPIDNLLIRGNKATGGGDSFGAERGLITVNVQAAASRNGRRASIVGNTLEGGATYPILLRRLGFSEVKGNKALNGAMAISTIMYGCDNIDVEGNNALDLLDATLSRVLTTYVHASSANGNTNIRARNNNIDRPASGTAAVAVLPTGSQGEGNTVNNASLSGTFTLSAITTNVVSTPAMRDGAKVNIYPANAAAWALQAGANRVSAQADPTNARIIIPAAASTPVGTEIFNYRIVQ